MTVVVPEGGVIAGPGRVVAQTGWDSLFQEK
jgi:hypothetical protein